MNRSICLNCRKASVMCYCDSLQVFASRPQFVILIHPKETRKAINTGRMAFLSISNALLLTDADFTHNAALNQLLNDPERRCYLLFPGPKAVLLAAPRAEENSTQLQNEVFIILDASWALAKKMYRLSQNLQSLPQIMFKPQVPSRFLIRKQPGIHCYSTIETIHYIIEARGLQPQGEHHHLLTLFETMVQKQIDYEKSENHLP